jgi:hypothetical protein
VSDYAHWGEEAEAVWYAENKYDMENWDEEIEPDDFEDRYYAEPDPDIEMTFNTEEDAQAFMDRPQDWGYDVESLSMTRYGDKWVVEGYTKELHRKYVEMNRRARFH